MSKLKLSDLEYDLSRKGGSALAQAALELLSRGRAGRSIVAQALAEGERKADLEQVLQERSGQVIEMLTAMADFAADPEALSLLRLLSGDQLARKAMQIWERGEHQRGQRLAMLVEEESPALFVMAREALRCGEYQTAHGYFQRSLDQGISLADMWEEWAAALCQLGLWLQASRLYEQACDLVDAQQVAQPWAQLLIETLMRYDPDELPALGQELLEVAARRASAIEHLFQAVARGMEQKVLDELSLLKEPLHRLGRYHQQATSLCLTILAEEQTVSVVQEQLGSLVQFASNQVRQWRRHLIALGLMELEKESPSAILQHLGRQSHAVDVFVQDEGELPDLMVDRNMWQLAWELLTDEAVSASLRVTITAPSPVQVTFAGLGAEVGETKLSRQTAALVFSRHLGQLITQADGWQVSVLAMVPQGESGELVSRIINGEPVSPYLCSLLECGNGAVQVWLSLHQALEQLRRSLYQDRLPALAPLGEQLQQVMMKGKTTSMESGPTLIYYQMDEWLAHWQRLLEWGERYLELPTDARSEYAQLQDLLTEVLERFGPGRAQRLESTASADLPRISLDPDMTVFILELVLDHLTGNGNAGSIAMQEVPERGMLSLKANWTPPAAIGGFQEMVLRQLSAKQGLQLNLGEGEAGLQLWFPQSKIEGELADSLPGLGRLHEGTRQALRAALALEQQADADAAMVHFLLGKAVEMELTDRVWPHLERHTLLPAVNRGWLSHHAGAIADRLGNKEGRALRSRCQSVENAITKGRMTKGLEDFRNLAVAVTGFALTFSGERVMQLELPDQHIEELARALYQCGELLGRPKETATLIPVIYRLLAVLSELPASTSSN